MTLGQKNGGVGIKLCYRVYTCRCQISGHREYVKKVQKKISETSRRGYLELGDHIWWDTMLEHVIEEKRKKISKNTFFR